MSETRARLAGSAVVAIACAFVAGLLSWMAAASVTELSGSSAADIHYNLLVEGFQHGHLSLNKQAPPGLARLKDPYDPVANMAYRLGDGLHDMTYYHGKLYLYFGVTPALVLFWPWAALTGHYLYHRYAVLIFCVVGFLAAAAVLHAMWRRYFPEVGMAVVAAGTLALGLATGVPVMLQRAEFWEVAVSCGYAFTMLALAAVWRALHASTDGSRDRWIGAASLALGLAVGARPSLVFNVAILLIPLAQAWRTTGTAGSRRTFWRLVVVAAVPLAACAIGLMLYNYLRFHNPFEFGERYQLAGDRQDTVRHFSLHYLWFNFCVYFLEPVKWGRHFPFVGGIATPPLPAGHFPIEDPFGALTNLPVVWLALAVPLAWRGLQPKGQSALRGFLAAVGVTFLSSATLLCLFYGNCSRYEVEFLPELVFLAVVGILGSERALAGRPGWRATARAAWGALLVFSIAFNLLNAVAHYATQRRRLGNLYYEEGHIAAAIAQYRTALRFNPDSADTHSDLGNALTEMGRTKEAIAECETALRLEPGNAKAHNNLGNAYLQSGRTDAAIAEYTTALQLVPKDARVQYNFGNALLREGRLPGAIAHYESALRLKPGYVEAHYNLGNALFMSGRMPAAIAQYEAALRLRPAYVEAHNNLGSALLQVGRIQEAIAEFRTVVRLRPGYPEGHNNLGSALYRAGQIEEAVEECETALRLKPDYRAARENLERMRGKTTP